MSIKVGILGLGRVGRQLIRSIVNVEGVELGAVADPIGYNQTSNFLNNLVYLLKYDTNYGMFDGLVSADSEKNALLINGQEISVSTEEDPTESSIWQSEGVDVLIDATGDGNITSATKLLDLGIKKVIIITSNPQNNLPLIVMDVNETSLGSSDNIIQLSPDVIPVSLLLSPLKDEVVLGNISLIKSSNNAQNIIDGYTTNFGTDYSMGRSAFQNIVLTPNTTGKKVGLVIPELNGKFLSQALRVPAICGNLIQVTLDVKSTMTKDEVNALIKASEINFLKYLEDPVTSSDFNNNYSIGYLSKNVMANNTQIQLNAFYSTDLTVVYQAIALVKFLENL